MRTRRKFLKSIAVAPTASGVLGLSTQAATTPVQKNITVRPYQWEGPYSQHRVAHKALHDWRLCAEVKAPWPGTCEGLILRTSEIIGYETGFLYDDHFPPTEPDGRGKNYRHIPFEWKIIRPEEELYADCMQPGKGRFTLRLTAKEDFVDIRLSVRNDMQRPMENADWAFCAVAFESPSISDAEDERTYLFDGERLRKLGEMGGRDRTLFKVEGANGNIPPGHRQLPIGAARAKYSLVVIEGVDGKHSAALGFEQADTIYGDAKGNKCFHADPYFGPLIKTGEERMMRGKLYLMKGNAQAALERYREDFAR